MTASKRLILLLCLPVLVSACSWPMIPDQAPEAAEQAKAETALSKFSRHAELKDYFEQSVAIAVYPGNIRAATGFGAAFGTGWLLRDGQIIARSRLLELSAGANFGGQYYRQILFFKTEDALQRFMRGNFEFVGQTNVAVANWGNSQTPSFNREVALFTEVRGGLLLEASVGTHRYDVKPVAGYKP